MVIKRFSLHVGTGFAFIQQKYSGRNAASTSSKEPIYYRYCIIECVRFLASCCFQGLSLTIPVNAQTDTGENYNDLLKDSFRLLPDPKGAFVSSDNFMVRYADAVRYLNDTKYIELALRPDD